MASNSENLRDDVAEQLAAMRKEVSRLSAALSKQSSRWFDGASDEASELYEQGQKAARMLTSSARQHPVPAALILAAGVAVIVGALIATSRR